MTADPDYITRLRDQLAHADMWTKMHANVRREDLRAFLAERDKLREEVEKLKADEAAYSELLCSLGGGVDPLDRAGNHWLELHGVQRMTQAITSVFANWTSDEIMTRFQAKVKDMMHLAFVEGAVAMRAALTAENDR